MNKAVVEWFEWNFLQKSHKLDLFLPITQWKWCITFLMDILVDILFWWKELMIHNTKITLNNERLWRHFFGLASSLVFTNLRHPFWKILSVFGTKRDLTFPMILQTYWNWSIWSANYTVNACNCQSVIFEHQFCNVVVAHHCAWSSEAF